MKFTLLQKTASFICLVSVLMIITGCPYSSSVPIDEGTVQVKPELEGKWVKASDKDSENPTYFELKKEDKTHAIALKYEFSSNDSIYESTTYHLTFSNVGGEVFMNALEEGGSSYSLFKFEFNESAGEITTYEVTDYIKETFNTSAELKKFIDGNKNASYFFTNTVDNYVRM
jgi:hypothetical protein